MGASKSQLAEALASQDTQEQASDAGAASPDTLAARLMAARSAAGLSVRDACKLIGARALTPAAVYLLERGKRKHPTTITVEMLARAYGSSRWRQVASWIAFGMGAMPQIEPVVLEVEETGPSLGSLIADFYAQRIAAGTLEFQLNELIEHVAGSGHEASAKAIGRMLRRMRRQGAVAYKLDRASATYRLAPLPQSSA